MNEFYGDTFSRTDRCVQALEDKIIKLEARIEAVNKITERLEILPQETLYSRGIASEYRAALEGE